MVEAAGGWTAFLDRYAVTIVADHSQSAVARGGRRRRRITDLRLFRSSRRSDPDQCDLALAASNRVAMAYLLPGARADRPRGGAPARPPPGRRRDRLARGRLARGPPRGRRAAVPARRRPRGRAGRPVVGGRRPRPARPGRSTRTRWSGSRASLGCRPPATSIVSARLGWEFADAGGHHHAGGGSHGSLRAEDSLVPLITAGFERRPGLPAASRRSPTSQPLVAAALAGDRALAARDGAPAVRLG